MAAMQQGGERDTTHPVSITATRCVDAIPIEPAIEYAPSETTAASRSGLEAARFFAGSDVDFTISIAGRAARWAASLTATSCFRVGSKATHRTDSVNVPNLI
jgi:hypothetical protein